MIDRFAEVRKRFRVIRGSGQGDGLKSAHIKRMIDSLERQQELEGAKERLRVDSERRSQDSDSA